MWQNAACPALIWQEYERKQKLYCTAYCQADELFVRYISFTAASEDFFYLNTFNLIARLKLANDSKLRYMFKVLDV